MDVKQMATKIYNIIYDGINSKTHRSINQGDIEKWLTSNNLNDNKTVEDLAENYRNDWAWVEQQSSWC